MQRKLLILVEKTSINWNNGRDLDFRACSKSGGSWLRLENIKYNLLISPVRLKDESAILCLVQKNIEKAWRKKGVRKSLKKMTELMTVPKEQSTHMSPFSRTCILGVISRNRNGKMWQNVRVGRVLSVSRFFSLKNEK